MKYSSLIFLLFALGCHNNIDTIQPALNTQDESSQLVDEGILAESGCGFNGIDDLMSCQFHSNYIERYNQYKAAVLYALNESLVDRSKLNVETKLALIGKSMAVLNYVSFNLVQNEDYRQDFQNYFFKVPFSVQENPLEVSYIRMENYLKSLASFKGGLFVDFSASPVKAFVRGAWNQEQIRGQFEQEKAGITGHLDMDDPEQRAASESFQVVFDAIQSVVF